MGFTTTPDPTCEAFGRTTPVWRRAEFVAAVASVLCYVNVLPNDYCLDDKPIVQRSVRVNGAEQWAKIWTTDHWSEYQRNEPGRDLLYRPVSLMSYRSVGVLFGSGPLAQHFVNLLLHAAITLLVVFLCRRLGGSETACAASGILFAVLPVHTEAVASVVGRADLLAVVCLLATALAHLRATENTALRSKACWYTLAAVAAFSAIGSKENGLTVVPLIVLLDAYWFTAKQQPLRQWMSLRTLVRVSYLIAPVGLYFALRYVALGGKLFQAAPLTKTANILVGVPPYEHFLGVMQLWGMYWAKTFWPAVLSIKYSINGLHLASGWSNGHVLLGTTVLIALGAASVIAWRRGARWVAFLTLAIIATYLPTANVFVLMRVYLADRVWYLPSVWVCIMVGMAIARPLRGEGMRLLFGALALAMMGRCWIRNAEWHDNGTLFAAAYRTQPESIGPLQLYGQWLTNNGRPEEGINLLTKAVEIDLGFTNAHRSLGQAYLRMGNRRAALRHLQAAEMQAPGHPQTVATLQRVIRELNTDETDLAQLRENASENPDNVSAELDFIRELRDRGLLVDAVDRCRAREESFGDLAEWQRECAVTFVMNNERDEAIERYQKSWALDSDDAQVAVELAMVLLERQRGDDLSAASDLTQQAMELAPRSTSALAARAEVLATRGDPAGAVALLEQAIDLLPEDGPRRRIFVQRAKALGGERSGLVHREGDSDDRKPDGENDHP